MRVLSAMMLPPLRVELGSTASTATLCPLSDQAHAKALDKGALAHPRNTGNAQTDGPSRMRQEPVQNGTGDILVAVQGAFDHRDGFGKHPPVALQHAVHIIRG